MARICRGLADEAQTKARTEAVSTEEMMYRIAVTNESISKTVQTAIRANERSMRDREIPRMQDLMSTVVISMDVCALYPSIKVKLAKDTIVKMVKRSNLP